VKIFSQLCIIFCICFAAEIIAWALPVDIPANMIGMGLLFLLLILKIIKKNTLDQTSDFLLSNMAIFFIPATVSIIAVFDIISDKIFAIVFICIISTFVTFAATAYTVKFTNWLIKKCRKGERNV